ncbi:unnamed protein product, partial [Rotaria sp. Silwood1]
MGSSNSVNITINLYRTNPFFYAGESVTGTVSVNIKEGHITVDELFIVLKDETGYTTTHTIHESNGSTRTETHYHHTIVFFSEKNIFERPGSGKKKESVYLSGQYLWRFDIQLPPQLPSTTNESHNLGTNETLYLTVFPRVNLLNNPQCLISSVFGNHNRKDVTLKGNIYKLGYVPGEMITGILEIENPRKILLKQVYLSLIQHYRIECNTGKETIIQTILPTIVNTKQEHITEKFSIAIPLTYLAPSYEFHGGFQHMANVHVNYILEFDVKAEGMFTNFDVNIPITLATESDTNLN